MKIVETTPDRLVIRQDARSARTAVMAAGGAGFLVTLAGMFAGLTFVVLGGAAVVATIYAAWAWGLETMVAELDRAAGTARVARRTQKAVREETLPLAEILPPDGAEDPEAAVCRRLRAAAPLTLTPYTTTARVPAPVARAILRWAAG